jgi:hypothetical protein
LGGKNSKEKVVLWAASMSRICMRDSIHPSG